MSRFKQSLRVCAASLLLAAPATAAAPKAKSAAALARQELVCKKQLTVGLEKRVAQEEAEMKYEMQNNQTVDLDIDTYMHDMHTSVLLALTDPTFQMPALTKQHLDVYAGGMKDIVADLSLSEGCLFPVRKILESMVHGTLTNPHGANAQIDTGLSDPEP